MVWYFEHVGEDTASAYWGSLDVLQVVPVLALPLKAHGWWAIQGPSRQVVCPSCCVAVGDMHSGKGGVTFQWGCI
jgi:hypothetical protein